MRILFLGDIVGAPGVDMVRSAVPLLRTIERIDLVIANAENAAAGSGMTPRTYRQLRQAGVDAFTMGDHIYKKMDLVKVLESEDRICKPANFPADAPGKEVITLAAADGVQVAVFSLLGRTFMRPVDCPFRAADRVLEALQGKICCILVDAHAEATADKYLLAHHLKGRVSAVLGTHTHVPTADEQILPGGTAFVCDVGMCGPYDSILGRRVDRVLYTTVTFIPSAFEVAQGDPRLAGAIVDIDSSTGKALTIRRVMLDENAVKKLQSPPVNGGEQL
ncbi:MAG: TIGR00282 family metallophosphoesterase [Gemmataceae bacterium]|nr:TIGR00282 family metallophosphoesterase [Gemmataceae bacterium]MCI0739384.1 TIGR00282 family metallophosphoesterase [Gemmataceae bacterium]